MKQLLNYLQQRQKEDWIVGFDCETVSEIAKNTYQQIIDKSRGKTPLKILIAETKQLEFIAYFIAAVTAGCPVFLCNPHWIKSEWQQVFNLVKPDLILGKITHNLNSPPTTHPLNPLQNPLPNSPILIPTGGTSGKIKFAVHSWETLTASVRGFQEYFQVPEINSFCVLPLYHVSGLMQFIRSFVSGGKLVILPSYKDIWQRQKWDIDCQDFFISLVPTQLQRLLETPATAKWLANFKTVLLGGAPAWGELFERARKYEINLAPTYGMTETASQIATLKPIDFLAGNNSSGRILPHAKVRICGESGEILEANKIGIVKIEAESLARGYYPEIVSDFASATLRDRPRYFPKDYFPTDDLGYLDEKGFLHIVGRGSDKIISGGENVFPAEVEAAILGTGLVKDVCVIGLSDRLWGEVVTAVYVANNSAVSAEVLAAAVEDKLSKFKRPKFWVKVEQLPRNSQGKISREKVKEIVKT